MRRSLATRWLVTTCGALVTVALAAAVSCSAQSLGAFEHAQDVGTVLHKGSSSYDAATKTYTITGSGENMWVRADAFQFLWKKAEGDIAFSASIRFPHPGGSPHRKAALIFRQSLADDSVYADAAVHGVGLTALQYRTTTGDYTRDSELTIAMPTRIRVEKRGDAFTLFVAGPDGVLHPSGSDIRLHLDGSYYLGLGVCAHDKDALETAEFSDITIEPLGPASAATAAPGKPMLVSTLNAISIDPQFVRTLVAYTATRRFEAPNWTRDGKDLIFDMGGKMMRVSADGVSGDGGQPQPIDTGAAVNCNGSHGISPDGTQLAISCFPPGAPSARVYVMPLSGATATAQSEPRLVTEHAQSYFHSWSPDGKTIVFTRPGNGFNILTIPLAGGEETQITHSSGVNDDPDFAPDGKWIYYNSDRGGASMQIWRMWPDGSHAEQVTHDERNNWTPHPSPDGKWIVYVSYGPGVSGHPANKEIELRLMSLADHSIQTLVSLLGGTGTMNVNSWAPDSKHLAYVSYELIPQP